MKRSKKGTWIVEDDRYKYVVELNNLEILPIKMYRVNFNRVTVMIPKSANKPDKFIEVTWSKEYFKDRTFTSIELAMSFIIKFYLTTNIDDQYKNTLKKYYEILSKDFPELLI